jgi:glycosyltransferase involved in cell wall biosynthesis
MPWGIDSVALRCEVGSLISRFDLVHLAAVWQPLGLVVANAARKAGVPYISSLHGTLNAWAWSQRKPKHYLYWHLFERHCLAHASALHVTSDQERTEAQALGVGLKQEFVSVPNGVRTSELERSSELAASFRAALNVPPDKQIILFFGRIHPKNVIDRASIYQA